MNHYNLANPASSNDYITYMALSWTSKLLSLTERLQAPMVSVVLYPSVIVLEFNLFWLHFPSENRLY